MSNTNMIKAVAQVHDYIIANNWEKAFETNDQIFNNLNDYDFDILSISATIYDNLYTSYNNNNRVIDSQLFKRAIHLSNEWEQNLGILNEYIISHSTYRKWIKFAWYYWACVALKDIESNPEYIDTIKTLIKNIFAFSVEQDSDDLAPYYALKAVTEWKYGNKEDALESAYYAARNNWFTHIEEIVETNEYKKLVETRKAKYPKSYEKDEYRIVNMSEFFDTYPTRCSFWNNINSSGDQYLVVYDKDMTFESNFDPTSYQNIECELDGYISGYAFVGNLTINNHLDLSNTSVFYVGGNLKAPSIHFENGATEIVGNIEAEGYIYAKYNDGSTTIGGNITASLLVCNDHFFFIDGYIQSNTICVNYSGQEDSLDGSIFAQHLVPFNCKVQDFKDEFIDDEELDLEKIAKARKQGIEVLKDGE